MQSRTYIVIALAALVAVVLLAYAYRGTEVSTVAPTEPARQEEAPQTPPADTDTPPADTQTPPADTTAPPAEIQRVPPANPQQ